jgi:hypothetical protein
LPLQDLASGIYFVVLQADGGEGLVTKETFKLAVTK